MANIVPIYKKNVKNHVIHYRPVSLLPICSKVFERLARKTWIPWGSRSLSWYIKSFWQSIGWRFNLQTTKPWYFWWLLRLLKSFLFSRKKRVVLNYQCSDWQGLKSCVPQGSILGSSLFLICIKDLPKGLKSSAKLFADTSIFSIVKDPTKSSNELNSDLKLLTIERFNGKCLTIPTL